MSSVIEAAAPSSESWTNTDLTNIRVAIAGCGAVGTALVRELASRRDALATRHGVIVAVQRVLVRDITKPRDAAVDPQLLTDDVEEFLNTEADVVIEAIGGLDPALRIAHGALERGRDFITANKLLLALHGRSLTDLARVHGVAVRYDAAVGGGVPVLRMIDDALGAGGVTRVRGILNGTANYVLSHIERGATFDGALASARTAGFAEQDAARDLDGRDAADKIALVAWTAFGATPDTIHVRRRSLLPHVSRYVGLAERFGLCVRQIAECTVTADGIVASVEPVCVAPASAWGLTRDEGNRVDVDVGWRAPLCASGPGAGGLPTATALLSDLLSTGTVPNRISGTPSAIHDGRRFQWALEVLADPSVLHRVLVRDGSLVSTDAAAGASWTLIESATPAEIAALIAALDADGRSPIAARVDEYSTELHAEASR